MAFTEADTRRRRPRRSVRMRLTALYGSVFLASSVALLTIVYFVVRHVLHTRRPSARALRRLGLHPHYEFGFKPGTHNARLVHTLSESIIDQALQRLLVEYVVALVIITVAAALIGWLLAGRVLRPLREITATARRVSGENLGERIDLRGPDDELKELATTFDGMLERLDAAFASQRRFVANASHELRTPLAIMRTEIDVALGDPAATVPELRTMGEAVRDTVDRCERLIASLLLLARSEASPGYQVGVDLAVIVADCVTDLRVGAAERRIDIVSTLQSAWVDGDPGLLERLVANLLDNGIHHNVEGGRLTIAVSATDGQTRLTVANGGPRIDPADVAVLTEPFRRLDRSSAGFGLGLSIVRSIAAAHHGTTVLRALPGGGLRVDVTLPGQDDEEPAAGPAPGAGMLQRARARA